MGIPRLSPVCINVEADGVHSRDNKLNSAGTFTCEATNAPVRMARLALSVVVVMLAVIALTEGLRGFAPKRCCFHFRVKQVSKEKVVGYVKTSQRCSNPAILLNTKEGRTLCVRPSELWVKELVSYLNTKNTPGETTNL